MVVDEIEIGKLKRCRLLSLTASAAVLYEGDVDTADFTTTSWNDKLSRNKTFR
jgi:hypothetical protein